MKDLQPLAPTPVAVARRNDGQLLPLSARELVGLTELFYGRVVRVSMWVGLPGLAFAVLLAGVKVREDHLARTATLAVALALPCVWGALRPERAYRALRACPPLLFGLAIAVGVAMTLDGGLRSTLYFPAHVVVALGAATGTRRASIAAGATLAVATVGSALLAGYTPTELGELGELDVIVGGALGITLWSWLLWALLDRLADFALSLNRVGSRPPRPPPVRVENLGGVPPAAHSPVASPNPSEGPDGTANHDIRSDHRSTLGLTARQLEVALLLAEDYSTGEIAAALGISPRTVYRHVEQSKDRAGAATREQLAALIVAAGLIDHAPRVA